MPLAIVFLTLGATLPAPRVCGTYARANCSLRRPFPRMTRLQTMRYDGKLLGVSASVLLDRQSERAMVNLKGVPVGGSLTGMAWFKKDGESVIVENELYQALGRRGVSIVNAGAYKDYSYVWVRVKLPLGLGTHRMILPRTYKKTSIHSR